ncbi:polysaccharide pyruvyl transferase family protein [Haloarcula laminariae]|uniref:polysaccharide pyruvyl transferase family protein n=1 Tax=Haloarcula laminariae TaxID=2961577 RepID=UPI0021C69F2D|nr:polysaccharide pyruvyl transferase family protein [Halomicroarcula laminariae]
MRGRIQAIRQKLAFGAAVSEQTIFNSLSSRAPNSELSGENIVIVGGELFNKGAQAMTFTVVDRIKRRFPEKSIYLFSNRDYQRNETEKQQYDFTILPWSGGARIEAMSSLVPAVYDDPYPQTAHEKVKSVLNDCACIIDINGYALSSQWGFQQSLEYMSNLISANQKRIPIYILPQSIGPFAYTPVAASILKPLFSSLLPSAEIICPREKEGVECLRPYTTENVQLEYDIVLQYQEYDLENVFTEVPKFRVPTVEGDAVGVVPNSRLAERKDRDELREIYNAILETLLAQGKDVYVLRHSSEDKEICTWIKSLFENRERVHLLDDDLNAIELERTIEQFDYLIGSRYHSLVHSYRNSVPVIAIGWATKYGELLENFEQSAYFFDGRDKVEASKVESAIRQMETNKQEEREIIQGHTDTIRQRDLLTQLFGSV